MRFFLALSLACTVVAACQCGPPPVPPVKKQIGDGDPIGPPDAGDPDLHDSGPVSCVDDGSEPNDTRDTATVLTSAAAVDGVSCGGNDDFYVVATNLGCDLDVHMVQGDGIGNVGVLLFDPAGTLVGASTGFGTEQAIHLAASADGNYAVRLRSGARDDVPYTLTFTSTCPADLTCPTDDAHEPNDGPGTLASLTPDVAAQGILCGTNEDWYLVPAGLGCIADARLDFVDAQGDIDMVMLLSDGVTPVATSEGTGDEERIKKVVTSGGMMLRVHFFNGDAGSINPYHLVTNEICAGQIGCPSDDPFEPNDDRGSATDLFAPIDEVIGAICGSNEDFFSLELAPGCTLHANMSFVNAEGDLDLELQDSGGNQLAISQGSVDNEQIDFPSSSDQFVFLRVFGFQGANNEYRLHVNQSCP